MTGSNKDTPPPAWLAQNNGFQPIQQDDLESTTTSTPMTDSQRGVMLVHWVIKLVSIFFCGLMMATAIIGIEYITDIDSTEKLFVAIYLIFFALLLFLQELSEIKKMERLEFFFRRNFGFMYNILGKALFIVFIAFLCFGLGDPVALTYSTGFGLAIFGALQVGLYLKYPEYFEVNPWDPNAVHNGSSSTASASALGKPSPK